VYLSEHEQISYTFAVCNVGEENGMYLRSGSAGSWVEFVLKSISKVEIKIMNLEMAVRHTCEGNLSLAAIKL
jgi:hypothetical protein